jgi:arylsulfatase A-like enzyme
MDIAWLVLDSLGYEHTSFHPEGPETTPELVALAEERGIVFDEAYVAGPSSPSSHSAFLTGKRPSETGMHEAHPYFDGRLSTIADRLSDTHETFLTTVNPFLFNGLDESFDSSVDLGARQYRLFDSGLDPRTFGNRTDHDPGLPRALAFLREATADGTPFRSAINAIQFKLWRQRGNDFIPNKLGEEDAYRYAPVINDRLRDHLEDVDADGFALANYMDVHPPLNASDEAVERLLPPDRRNELPIGIRAEDTDEYDHDAMIDLYRASVWDLDRAVAPLVEDLLDRGAFVVVTADHGPRFGNDPLLGPGRLHVPLLIFGPDISPRRVSHTVSIQSLPATTMEFVDESDGGFDGVDLLAVDDDQTAITEHVHHGAAADTPVDAHGAGTDLRYDLYLRRGATFVRDVGGEREANGPEAIVSDLSALATELRATGPADPTRQRVEYDPATEERLEDLGYL